MFRAWHLDAQTIAAGDEFYFDLNLFEINSPAIAYLARSFAQLSRDGLGPKRSRVELTAVWQLGLDGLPLTKIATGAVNPEPAELELDGSAETADRVRLRFVTPTELKSSTGLATRPEFGILAARLRDRLSTLCQLYGSGPLPIDFRAFGDRARAVRMTRCDIQHVAVERQSSRTGQVHSIGGCVGEAEYQGELSEFLPMLRAAKWTGVGRQTVWGKGEVIVL